MRSSSASLLSSVLALPGIARSRVVSSSTRESITSATSAPSMRCSIVMLLCSAAALTSMSVMCVCIWRVARSSSRAATARCSVWLYADCRNNGWVLKGAGLRYWIASRPSSSRASWSPSITRLQAAMMSSTNIIFLKKNEEMKIDQEGDVDEKKRKQPVDVKFA